MKTKRTATVLQTMVSHLFPTDMTSLISPYIAKMRNKLILTSVSKPNLKN